VAAVRICRSSSSPGEAINEGVNFYLQKGGQPKAQFAELSHKIRQAISHKQAQEALSASEQFQRAVLSSSPIGIGLVRNHRILDWTNDAMYSMTGYSQEELFGQITRMLYPDDGEFRRAGELLYETGEVETEWVRKDGAVFPCIVRISPLNPASVEDGVIAAVVDITELIQPFRMSTQRWRVSGVIPEKRSKGG